jgi:hypothetical protein
MFMIELIISMHLFRQVTLDRSFLVFWICYIFPEVRSGKCCKGRDETMWQWSMWLSSL